ncbi:TDP-N-acetylfucosamine:lipid II N-acetylfucosaminyltransferase [Escherichia coli]|uniref:TDP-N-acetylfucosamine:lipid II N-acetylfucosaminyltransferase n=1 Tax=Escherichia coli TaxID=562 RepID=UPI00388F6AC7
MALSPVSFLGISGGQDLYELSSGLRYKLLPTTSPGAKRVGCVFATRGDLSFLPKRTQRCGANCCTS